MDLKIFEVNFYEFVCLTQLCTYVLVFSFSKGSEKFCFCKLAKGKRSNLKTYFLKSPYFCVLHPLLGKRNINFSFFDFQLTLLYRDLTPVLFKV